MAAPIKPSLKDQQRSIAASVRGLESMYGDIRRSKGMPEHPSPDVKDKQVRGPVDESVAEAGVMSDVSSLLSWHPQIIVAIRQNSGAAWLPGKNQKQVPIWFYRVTKSPDKVRIVDWWGLGTFGLWAIECKHRGWIYKGTDEREREQNNFLSLVRKYGGRAGFATSSHEAQRIIEGR